MAQYRAFWKGTLAQEGIDMIIVSRHRGPGDVEFAAFLVDSWCLGIKDAAYNDESSEELLADAVTQYFHGEEQALDPACAKKIIEGAEAYAQRLGFAPARDYRKARRVLGGIDAKGCKDEFTFGAETGQPRYVPGPDDSPERIERVLGILRARCGEDGFEFVEPEEDEVPNVDPVEVIERAANYLRDLLDARTEPTPTFRQLYGLLGAIATGPQKPPLDHLVALLVDRCLADLDADDRAEFELAVATIFMAVISDFSAAVEAPEGAKNPIQFVDVEPDDKMDSVSFAISWCRGFILAFDLWPDIWRAPLANPELAPHFDVIRAFANPDEPGNLEFLTKEAEAGHNVGAAVYKLFAALNPDMLS